MAPGENEFDTPALKRGCNMQILFCYQIQLKTFPAVLHLADTELVSMVDENVNKI